MKKLLGLAAVTALVLGILSVLTPVDAAPIKSCATVRCAGCPDGQHLLLKWPNCCACVPN